jgi:hypothetical protein
MSSDLQEALHLRTVQTTVAEARGYVVVDRTTPIANSPFPKTQARFAPSHPP